jgi:hypothetical protein
MKFKTDAECQLVFDKFMKIKEETENLTRRIQVLASLVQNPDMELSSLDYYSKREYLEETRHKLKALDEKLESAWEDVYDYLYRRIVEEKD